jgi:hypothetical protein
MVQEKRSIMWAEVTSSLKHGIPPKLVPLETINNYTGFRSLYGYGDEVKNYIENNQNSFGTSGSVVGLAASRLPVFSDVLFVDFDDNAIPSGKLLTSDLREIGVGYSVWDSGGRSIHVHINVMPYEDWRVPYSQKQWITEWMVSRNVKADLSIYHAAGLFRLPGTLHHKTGKPKTLIDEWPGSLLDYELLDHTVAQPPSDVEEATRMVWRMLLTYEVSSRHFHVFKITSQADRLGWNSHDISEALSWWNSRIKNPLNEEDLSQKMWQSLTR